MYALEKDLSLRTRDITGKSNKFKKHFFFLNN